MTYPLNVTHDPAVQSWIESARDPSTDFPIQNLPFGVFSAKDARLPPRIGVAIGDFILDIAACDAAGLFDDNSRAAAQACHGTTLNALMSLKPVQWSAFRKSLHELLRNGSPAATKHRSVLEQNLIARANAEMLLPAAIGDYTDFYASIFHATNVGKMFRPDNPLLPNYKYVPIAYHARASSIVVSGAPVHRPVGQIKAESSSEPSAKPSERMDYEAEVGFFVGPGNDLGSPISIATAGDHVFGMCLLNDWSARDIQSWEYQPLGPFLSKNFATSISPWVVTMEALEPFRCADFHRPAGDPAPLPYLSYPKDQEHGGLDLVVEVFLSSRRMRQQGHAPTRLSQGNFRDMYWTVAQMVAHHTSNGCNLRPGDLLGSGTISGESEDARGCLLELTSGGTRPFHLPTGEERKFLEDGDEVTLRAFCEKGGFARIGFGECKGVI
ncbi:MAG: fumarylacetoacetase [Candidatus Acidiferrum sp.]